MPPSLAKMLAEHRLASHFSSDTDPVFASSAASLLLRFCCGLWSRGDRGRSCQLGVEQEQQSFVVRERHPVDLPGVTPNLCGESDVVGGPGDESAVTDERLVHDFLATEARNGHLESGKITPRP
jgi:hypothetical protein